MKRIVLLLVLLLGTVNLFGGANPSYLVCGCGKGIYNLSEVYEHRGHLTDSEITVFIDKRLNDEYTFCNEYNGRPVNNLIDEIADTDDKKNFFCKYMKVFIEKAKALNLNYLKNKEEECKKIEEEALIKTSELVKKDLEVIPDSFSLSYIEKILPELVAESKYICEQCKKDTCNCAYSREDNLIYPLMSIGYGEYDSVPLFMASYDPLPSAIIYKAGFFSITKLEWLENYEMWRNHIHNCYTVSELIDFFKKLSIFYTSVDLRDSSFEKGSLEAGLITSEGVVYGSYDTVCVDVKFFEKGPDFVENKIKAFVRFINIYNIRILRNIERSKQAEREAYTLFDQIFNTTE